MSIAKLVKLRAMLIITILMISSGAQATELGNGLLGVARYGGSTLPSEPELVSAIANSDGIQVTFKQSSEDGGFPISGYQYSVDSVTWYDIPFGLNTFTIPLSIATPGSSFSIQLRAVSQAGSSSSSPSSPVAVPPITYSVTPSAGDGGAIAPNTIQTITEGDAATFTLATDALFEIDAVSGTCGGSLLGNTYTTNTITADCTVIANFKAIATDPKSYSVIPSTSDGGEITPNTVQTITQGDAATFTLAADALFEIDTVSGTCGGSLEENTYTTDPITADCTVIANFSEVSNVRTARPIPTLNTWMLLTLLGSLLLLARKRIHQ